MVQNINKIIAKILELLKPCCQQVTVLKNLVFHGASPFTYLLYMPFLIGIIITEYVINQNHAHFYMVFLCHFVAKFFPTIYVTISVRFVRGIL